MAAAVARVAADPARDLYDAIGDFLADQRLGVDPVNYAFVHRILSQPNGPLAQAVRALTDGGVRLTGRDIETLGGNVQAGAREATAPTERAPANAVELLVAQTQMQVDGFADMVSAMQEEAQDFGRDLAASADALRNHADNRDILRLTAEMVDRVRVSEERLERARQETATLREQLDVARDDARRDPLTDLPNRRGFIEAFTENSATGVPLCLAVCDVDHFKNVNDRFGHAIGDRVLAVLGDSLAEACRGHVVARYGGEEFAVLFVGLDAPAAVAMLEAARERIASRRYRVRENAEPLGAITISAGFVAVSAGEPVEAAFARADALLYQAKANGRNRVVGN